MTVTNNKSINIYVKVSLGNMVSIEKVEPNQSKSIPALTNVKQVTNSHHIRSGAISVA